MNKEKLNEIIELSKTRNTLYDLQKGDMMFCIIFVPSGIYDVDYVHVTIHEHKYNNFDDDKTYSITADSRPTVSSYIHKESMFNHYFLIEKSSFKFFFTLKPERWKLDLEKEMLKQINYKTEKFNNDITEFSKNINNNIINGEEVDTLIQLEKKFK